MTYAGIDIGKNGGLVAIYPNGSITTTATPIIGKEIDTHLLSNMLTDLIHLSEGKLVVVAEDVHSIFGAGAKSNFQFGRALGLVEGILCSLRIPFEKVAPKTWQKVCFLGVPNMTKPSTTNKSGEKNDTKGMALIAAQRLYPNLDLRKSNKAKIAHDGIVDSLLLAHYGKLKYK